MRIPTVLLLAACALPVPCSAQLRDENVIFAPPDGFAVGYEQRNGRSTIVEFVPQGQTVEHWGEMVTLQIFRGAAVGAVPALRSRAHALLTAACKGSTSADVAEGTENSYAFAFWLDDCPLNPASGTPERTFVKAIGGRDALYVVQRAFRIESTKEQVVAASTFLRAVQVCDTRTTDHPCPEGLVKAVAAPQ